MSADQPLAGHRVVITGASSGIGAATAVAFAAAGARVVLGARGREGLDDVARRCAAAGGNASVRPVDCTDAAAVATFAAEARACSVASTCGSAARRRRARPVRRRADRRPCARRRREPRRSHE
ncbi:SDR family NAD(P)-dependent oxidoreductase [Sphingomonas sp. Ant20]|uniref:SDR family NAD(P)-dependent oxidoreductase n=1 Tax=Sphingomonas sp. Ant20 TaxID=104605 RepID=UPI00274251A0|nr:SDR family NAD(P)-dependent oxidoreductase [Sphingomonas sp. Ant20]